MAANRNVSMTFRFSGVANGFVNAARSAASALKPLDANLRKVNSSFGVLGAKANLFKQQASGAHALGSSYKGLIGQVTSMNRGFNILASSIRQVGQGLQNFGTTMSVFISLPLGAFIRGSMKDALAFNDALIEVRKTTGLAGKDLETLSKNLRGISLESPTDPKTLADIAAAWGRMGVSGVDAISQLTKVTDQLQIATTLTAEQAVTDLGRIGNIMYSSTEEFVANYEKLGSAINELGQANAVTEDEIVASALRMAPAAKALGFEVEQLLALSTTAAATNASAERAGTQTARAISMTGINLEKVAALTGETTDAIADMVRTDAEGFFMDLVYSLNQVDDPLTKIIGSTEIFGRTGAKSVQSLAAAFPVLASNIAIANEAYSAGTSLQMEYNRALDSVQTQMGILRNNVRYLATDIANTLLPYITKFAALTIPVIQLIIGLFESLSERTRFLVIGVGLLLTALGPLLVALGSIGFSLGIMATGVSALVTAFFTSIGSVLSLAGAIIGLLAPFKLVIGVVAAAGAALFAFSSQLGQVSNVVQAYIAKAYNWGYNLIASFAKGIADAAGLIYNTVLSVVKSFIGLIQAFSPPKEGPLKNIQTWGSNTMQAFVDGMRDIDLGPLESGIHMIADTLRGMLEAFTPDEFSVFEDLWGTLQSTINSIASSIGLTGNDLKAFLGDAASELARIVTLMQNGALESAIGSLGGLSGVLGEFTGDIEQLIDLQMQYSQLAQEIEEVEDALNGVNNAYDEQLDLILANDDLTAAQRAAQIRQAMMDRVVAQEDLEDKQAELEDLAGQIEQREGIIQILTSLLSEPGAGGAGGASALDDMADSAGDLMEELGSFDLEDASGALSELGEGALSDLKDKFDEAGEGAENFIDKIARGRDVIAGFVAALRGDDMTPEQLEELGEAFTLGFSKGKEIRDSVLAFLEEAQGYYAKWLMFVGFMAGAFSLLALGIKVAMGVIDENDFTTKITEAETVYGKFGATLLKIGRAIGTIANKLGEMGQAFIDNVDPDGTLADKLIALKDPLSSISRLLVGIAALVFDNMDELAGALGMIVNHLIVDVSDGIVIVGILSELVLIAAGYGDVERLAGSLSLLGDGFGTLSEDADTHAQNIKTVIDFIRSVLAFGKESFDEMPPFYKGIAAIAGSILKIGLLAAIAPTIAIDEIDKIIARISSAIEEVKSWEYSDNGATRAIAAVLMFPGTITETAVMHVRMVVDSWMIVARKIKAAIDTFKSVDETTTGKVPGHAKMVVDTHNTLGGITLATANLAISITNKFGEIIEKLKEIATSILTLPDISFDKLNGIADSIKEFFGNLSFGGGEIEGEQTKVTIPAPDIEFGDIPEDAAGTKNELVNSYLGGPVDRANMDGITRGIATTAGESLNTTLGELESTTYDPLATNIATWAAGDGATLIEENALSLATSLGTGIQTALEENTLFWEGLINSFITWWDESGFTWAENDVGLLIFDTVNNKMYDLFNNMLLTYEQIMVAANRWYNQTKARIMNFGKRFAKTVTDGIKEIFDDAEDYMSHLIDAMNAWIEANKDRIKEVGEAIGEIIGDAIVDEIKDAIDDLIDDYSDPDKKQKTNPRTNPNSSARTVVDAVTSGYQDTPVTSDGRTNGGVQINISVNGNVDSEKTAETLANEIYRRMALDMRYA